MNHTNKNEARVSDSNVQLAGKSPQEIARRWWTIERTKWRKTGDINARKSMRRAADARRRFKVRITVSDSNVQLTGKSPQEIAAEIFWNRLMIARHECPAINDYFKEWNRRANHSFESKSHQLMVLECNKNLAEIKHSIPVIFHDLL